MHLSKISGFAVAAFFAAASSAVAQTSTQTPTQTPTKTTTQSTSQSPTKAQSQLNNDKTEQTAAVQTFTGCLMTETDYRKAHNLGSGAAGGLGLGDEFVITDVKVTPANGATDATASPNASSSSMSASPSAMTCADKGVAYRLTGTQEEKIKPMNIVGHEIEVQGRFKHPDDVTASGAPTSGNLPAEVEIVSFREAPAPTPAPAATTTPAPSQPATVTPPPPPTPVTPEPATPTPTTQPRELPHTASNSALIAMIGVFALGAGLLMAMRRRVA